MSRVLSDIADYVTDKVSCSLLNIENYVGIDNLVPNRGGKTNSEYVPTEGMVTAYCKGDILIGNIRPYFKKIWLADSDGGCSPDVLCIRAKDGVSKLFLYAVLSQDAFFDYDLKGAKGSKMPRGDKDHIMVFPVPSLDNEDSLGSLIDSVYKKISINVSVCSELESMAKMFYDYWFVQFDFPDENGKPYKSSGGKMVWNEELKREIPEGWEVTQLSVIGAMRLQSVTPNCEKKYQHYSIPAFDAGKVPEQNTGREILSNKYIVMDRCLLISKLNPQFRRLWFVDKASENSICSTEFLPICSLNNSIGYLYEVMNSDGYQKHLIQNASSSTGSRKRIQPEDCMIYKFAYSEDIALKFHNIVIDMLTKMNQYVQENMELSTLRDFLLPMLMNGQVKIKKAE